MQLPTRSQFEFSLIRTILIQVEKAVSEVITLQLSAPIIISKLI